MARPLLPLGKSAPWLVLLIAAILAITGLITGNREMLGVGALAGVFWLVAFPVARALLGRDEPPDDGKA